MARNSRFQVVGGRGGELFGYAERNLITSSEMFAAGIRFWETITKKTEKHNSFIQGDGVLCWFSGVEDLIAPRCCVCPLEGHWFTRPPTEFLIRLPDLASNPWPCLWHHEWLSQNSLSSESLPEGLGLNRS